MPTKKKKVQSKKSPKKKIVKKVAKKRTKVVRVRKEEKPEESGESIFDSKVGDTDALFVNNPEPENVDTQSITDGVEVLPDSKIDSIIKQDVEVVQEEPKQEKKKTWWQKLFSI